jgi:hypothetical protein
MNEHFFEDIRVFQVYSIDGIEHTQLLMFISDETTTAHFTDSDMNDLMADRAETLAFARLFFNETFDA